LTEDNSRLSAELQIYKNDESSIAEALKESQKKAKLNERKIDMQYLATLQSLKRFSAKWRDYFEYLLEKYPYYSAIKQADELRKELDEALNRQSTSKSIQKIETNNSLCYNFLRKVCADKFCFVILWNPKAFTDLKIFGQETPQKVKPIRQTIEICLHPAIRVMLGSSTQYRPLGTTAHRSADMTLRHYSATTRNSKLGDRLHQCLHSIYLGFE
jgi:hypothetical protein